jgi:hypothetical protein
MQEIFVVLALVAAIWYLVSRFTKRKGGDAPGCEKCAPKAEPKG